MRIVISFLRVLVYNFFGDIMIEFQIKANDANQRLDKFLMKTMPTLPKSFMYKAIRNKKIKVNRKRCEISTRLNEGDIVLCFIPDTYYEVKQDYDFLHVPKQLDVVYENEHCLIVNKVSGLLSHKDQANIQDNLQDRILHYLYDQKVYDPKVEYSFTPAIAHRLDRNTSGLIIASKTSSFSKFISEKIHEHEVKKYYVCIVEGNLRKKQDYVELYHVKDEKLNKAKLYDHEVAGSKKIAMNYRVLQTSKTYSLVEVELISGKSHQIRSLMAYLKTPIYGDVKYGAKVNQEKTFQALCAYKIIFAFDDDSFIKEKSIVLENNEIINTYKRLVKKCKITS